MTACRSEEYFEGVGMIVGGTHAEPIERREDGDSMMFGDDGEINEGESMTMA